MTQSMRVTRVAAMARMAHVSFFCLAALGGELALCAEEEKGTIAFPVAYAEPVALSPDLCQTDPAFRSLPFEGRFWCCPTAFANALIALDRRGFPDLIAGDVGAKRVQMELLAALGGEECFHTKKRGTGPLGAMLGIRRFVAERGYGIEVAWQGWRRGGQFATADRVDRQWLREGVGPHSGVVLNVGWYREDPSTHLYTRFGGHYVTLVGYPSGPGIASRDEQGGKEAERDGESAVFFIHDPSPRSGAGKVTHRARLVPIERGRMAPWADYSGQSAQGHLLVEGIVLHTKADVAILDGAIRLTLLPPK